MHDKTTDITLDLDLKWPYYFDEGYVSEHVCICVCVRVCVRAILVIL
jgi:hypothetical protein